MKKGLFKEMAVYTTIAIVWTSNLSNAMQKNESAKSAKEIVMEYLQAAERRDFKSARSYLKDNLSYVSPLNSFDRAEPYLKYFEHVDLPPLDIKKEFADSNDVCILHELTFTPHPMIQKIVPPTGTSFVCTSFHVDDDGKISSIRVVFDPRPFVQQK
jgi:uncharacterized protein YozE (UPF0346 family)